MTTLTEIKEVVNNKWREELLEGLEEVKKARDAINGELQEYI